MAEPLRFNDHLEAIQAIFASVPGSGTFDMQPGAISPWVSDPQQAPAFHWWGEIAKTSQKITSIPGSTGTMTALRTSLVIIEGWYPVITAAESEVVWRAMLEAVCLKLEQKRFLGLLVPIILETGPNILVDDQGMKTSLHQGDHSVLCHYCKIALTYSQEYEFTTED